MRKITKKDKRRLLIWSLLIVIVFSYLSVFSVNYWTQILSNKKEKETLEQQYLELLAKEEELNSEITKMQDPDYIAKYAREKFLLSKEGEVIIKVDEDW